MEEQKIEYKKEYRIFNTVMSPVESSNIFVQYTGPQIKLSPYLLTFTEPRNRLRGIDFASLCSLAGRYEK